MPSIPVWWIALVAAAGAPWCARVLQAVFARRLRRRTLDAIAGANAFPRPPEGGETKASEASDPDETTASGGLAP